MMDFWEVCVAVTTFGKMWACYQSEEQDENRAPFRSPVIPRSPRGPWSVRRAQTGSITCQVVSKAVIRGSGQRLLKHLLKNVSPPNEDAFFEAAEEEVPGSHFAVPMRLQSRYTTGNVSTVNGKAAKNEKLRKAWKQRLLSPPNPPTWAHPPHPSRTRSQPI